MKILFITSYFPPIAGGSAFVYFNLCHELAPEACVLTTWRHYMDGMVITSPVTESPDGSRFSVKRIELLRPVVSVGPPRGFFGSACGFLSEDLPIRIRVMRSVVELIHREQVEVVVLGELYSLAWLGRMLRGLFRVPYIHYIHGEELTVGGYSRLYDQVGLDSLRKADAVIVVSQFTYQEAVRCGVREDRLHLITNAVDSVAFSPGAKSERIMDRHGLRGRKVLLTVGRVEERKGHDAVIAALPDIIGAIPDVAYVIVGTGTYVDRLRALSSAAGVTDRVVFAGKVPDPELVEYYRTADVFIMPNRTLPNGDTEGFGLVFLEANACAKPVIGGNAGGVPDAIVNGETGLLVNGESTAEVADAAIRLLRDEALSERMGSAGRLRALGFNWKQKAEEFRSVCEQIIDPRWKEKNEF